MDAVNLKLFNTIKGMNESEALTKHISCNCRCEFHGRKCKLGQKWNNNECQCVCKKQLDIVYVENYDSDFIREF